MIIKVVYIAGPYRAANAWDREENIRAAERLALEVWRMGHAALCPHTARTEFALAERARSANNRYFEGALPDPVFLDGDIAMLLRCDAVLMTPDWERSAGAAHERDIAIANGIPVFLSVAELRTYLTLFP